MFPLYYHQLKEISELDNFQCGIEIMDIFIHSDLKSSLEEHKCDSYIVVDNSNTVVGFFALCKDYLILDDDYKEDMRDGFSVTPKPVFHNEDEKSSYLETHVFQVLDIAYLAVRHDRQRKGIGRSIVLKIFEMARNIEPSLMFVTVDALFLKEYSAVEFYRKCGFQPMYPASSENTVRMFCTLFRE